MKIYLLDINRCALNNRMGILRIFLVKVGKLFLVLAMVIRRMFCCIRRRRRNSDTPLPITADVRHVATLPLQQFPSNEGPELHNWMLWEDGEQPSSIRIVEKDQSHHNNNSNARGYVAYPNSGNVYSRQHSNSETEPDIDYFQGMVPEIKKTKKIIVKKRDDGTPVSNDVLSKRLAADPQMTPMITRDLEHWVDNEGTWEDSMSDDIVCDANAALKETKLLERDRRVVENQRRKQEKEATRITKKEHLATKIS